MEQVKVTAAEKFRERIQEHVKTLSCHTFGNSVEVYLGFINKLIVSGRKFGVTQIVEISPGQTEEALKVLPDLRELDMKNEVREYIHNLLLHNGATREELGLPSSESVEKSDAGEEEREVRRSSSDDDCNSDSGCDVA